MPRYSGREDLDSFIMHFKERLERADMPEDRWIDILTESVSGQIAEFLKHGISEETSASYEDTREALEQPCVKEANLKV